MRVGGRVIKSSRLPLWLLAGCLIVTIRPLYSASPVTFYTNLSAFQAAITNPSSFGFNNVQQTSYDSSAGLTIDNFNFVGPMTKSGGIPGYWLSVNGPNTYFNDYNRISPNSSLQGPAATSSFYTFTNGKLIITMPTGGVTAFGLQLWEVQTGDTSGAGTDSVTLTVNGATGTTVTPKYTGEGFIGFTSTAPITSVTLTGTAAEEFPEIGEVYTGTAQVMVDQTAPTVTAVQNLFDYSTNLCPGVLVVVYGTNFGTTVSAVTITVGGKPGYILPGGAATTELLAQIPFEVSPGPTTLIISVNGTPSAAFPMTLAATAPAFHTVDGSGSGSGVFQSAALALLTSAAPAKPGDTVVALVTGLGATNPPTATSATPKAGNVPVATPTITVGGQPATIKAVVSTQYAGSFQINFVVPDGVQGNAPIVLTSGGNSTSSQDPKNPITIPIFGITYIANNASFSAPGTTTPGTIVSLFGNGFGTTSQTVGFPATTFQDVSVTFNGTPAPLFHLVNTAPSPSKPPFSLGASQIDLLVPYELPYTGTVQVAVKTATQTSPNYALTMAAATPGMYYIPRPVHQDAVQHHRPVQQHRLAGHAGLHGHRAHDPG